MPVTAASQQSAGSVAPAEEYSHASSRTCAQTSRFAPHRRALSSMSTTIDFDEALISFVDLGHEVEDFQSAVIAGLAAKPKHLPCKFFYDERGSQLFDQICDLQEYYPTRTEIGILDERLGEIAEMIGRGAHLIELGSGASIKIRILLNALPDLARYTAVDISKSFLVQSAETLASDYPTLDVAAVCADFTRVFDVPDPPDRADARRVAFFPGSTIGNFVAADVVPFLDRVADMLGQGGGLLIGVDLKKDPAILKAAYNDAKGVTAAFNLNLLVRINRELGGDFDIDGFSHDAVYLEDDGRVEMRLVSGQEQVVTIGDRRFTFDAGEHIHTENSHKYTVDGFRDLCARAGFAPVATWTDDQALFSVHYFTVE